MNEVLFKYLFSAYFFRSLLEAFSLNYEVCYDILLVARIVTFKTQVKKYNSCNVSFEIIVNKNLLKNMFFFSYICRVSSLRK